MVVLIDSGPSSPTKSQQAWSSQPGTSAAGSEAAPSRYGAVPQSPQTAPFVPPPPAYEPDANAPLLPGPPQKRPRRLAVAKRFCSALSVAVVIFVALSILKHIIFDGLRFGPIEWDNFPRPEDGNVLSCTDDWLTAQGASFEAMGDVFNASTIPGFPVFSASKSFSLPIDSKLHYIVTRGGLSSGVLVVRGDEKADRDRIDVQVVARYHTQHALSRAEVCELRRPEGGVGLGIYTPSSRIEFGDREEDRIYFNVTVTIPISSKAVRNLNAFASNTQNFRHSIENLEDRVHFEHISLKSSNGAVRADQLFVSQGTIITSNGKITGKFNATDSLVLQTKNGAIDTEIGITNDDTHKASDLVLNTSNGRISSKISLLTTHNQRPQPKGGHFTVRATTSNGRLNIGFLSTPIDSLLDFEGRTTNGAADVALHAAYEGSYYLTSSGSVEIDDEHARDPTGRGRSRHLENKIKSRTVIQGTVVWDGDEDLEMGRALISTSNGLARLRLL